MTANLDITLYYEEDGTYKTFDIDEKNVAHPLDMNDFQKLGWTNCSGKNIMIFSNPEEKQLVWYPLYFSLLNNLKENCIEVIFEERDGEKYFRNIQYAYPKEFISIEEKDDFFDTVESIFRNALKEINESGELK